MFALVAVGIFVGGALLWVNRDTKPAAGAGVGEFLIRAPRAGLRVVGWYLPTFTDVDLDLRRLEQIEDFDVLGHRFDGVAVDIEATDDVTDVPERNRRLVDLSTRLRQTAR